MQNFEDFQEAARAICSVANAAFLPKKELDRWMAGLRVKTMIEEGMTVTDCAARMGVSRQTIYDALHGARTVDVSHVRRYLNEPHPIPAVQMVTETPKPVFRIAEELGWPEDRTRSHVLEALSGGFVRTAGRQELAPGLVEIFYQTTGKTYVHPDPRSSDAVTERMLRCMSIVRKGKHEDFRKIEVRLTPQGYLWALSRILPTSSGPEPVPPFFTEVLARRDRESKSRRRARGGKPGGVKEKRTDGVVLGFGPSPGPDPDAEEAMWGFLEAYKDGEAQVYPAFVGLDGTARRTLRTRDLPGIEERLAAILEEAAESGPEHEKNDYLLVLAWADVRGRGNGSREER